MTVYSFSIDDQPFSVEIGLIQGNVANVTVNQVPYRVRINGSSLVSSPASAPAPAPAVSKPLNSSGRIRINMIW